MARELSYSDQTAIFDPESFNWTAHVVGAGSIGSMVLFILAAMGVGVKQEIHLWDRDILESRNTPTQPIYRVESDRGRPKIEAARDFLLRQELDTNLTLHNEFVTAESKLEGIVISGVDSMKSRHDIFEAVKKNAARIPLYMDGRIGGEVLTLFTFSPTESKSRKYYVENWMFGDDKATSAPCGGRNIIGPPTVLAGMIAHQLTLWHRGMSFERHIQFHLKDRIFTAFHIEGGF